MRAGGLMDDRYLDSRSYSEDCQSESHEQDWMRKKQWRQPWNKRNKKRRQTR